jgi:hypothetical protein
MKEGKIMNKTEMLIEILKVHPCLTSKEMCGFAYRMFGEHISPSSISGTMRVLYSKGLAAKSKNDKNTTVYWLP